MNTHYYEVSVKYDQTQETGLVKKVTEKYLTEALSFTEAEKKMLGYIQSYASGEFDIVAIRRLQISEVFEGKDAASDRWYKAKLAFITLDERTGNEKRTSVMVMIKATGIDDARDTLREGMKGTLGEWEMAVLSETPIIDKI